MKPNATLLISALACALGLSAQQPRIQEMFRDRSPALFDPASGQSAGSPYRLPRSKSATSMGQVKTLTPVEEITGTTMYDLQTNNSIQNRIIADVNGVAAVWTYSNNPLAGTFPDRGTGYNFRSSGSWNTSPSSRIEDLRTGWPSIVHPANGSELVFNHHTEGPIQLWRRNAVGNGNWTGSTVPTESGRNLLWPRAISGGADGNTIHLVCLTEPTYLGGTDYQGLNGALLYFRSTDGGETWDIRDSILQGMGSDTYRGYSSDTYALHARGNKIALAVFGEFMDTYVMISENNGDTWTKRVVWDFPIPFYEIDMGTDIDNDGIQDTLLTSDGAGAVFVDGGLRVHLTFGTLIMTDMLDAQDEVYTFFPLNGDILYWNDTYGGAESVRIIASYPDYDPLSGPTGINMIGRYGNSGLCSHPQMAQDNEGKLFISYSAINDLFFNGQEYLRHIFAIRSEDAGETWSELADITPDLMLDGWEYMYASMSPHAYNNRIHLIIQRDDEPGLHVIPEASPDPAAVNDMIYISVADDLVNIEEFVLSDTSPKLEVFPNPAGDFMLIKTAMKKGAAVSVTDLSGRVIYRQFLDEDGRHRVDLSDVASGAYLLFLQSENVSESIRFIRL